MMMMKPVLSALQGCGRDLVRLRVQMLQKAQKAINYHENDAKTVTQTQGFFWKLMVGTVRSGAHMYTQMRWGWKSEWKQEGMKARAGPPEGVTEFAQEVGLGCVIGMRGDGSAESPGTASAQ